jgi:hypothetical protein
MMEVIGNAGRVGTAIGIQAAPDAECGVDHVSARPQASRATLRASASQLRWQDQRSYQKGNAPHSGENQHDRYSHIGIIVGGWAR